MTYSNSVKDSVLKRVLPHNNEKLSTISKEFGIPKSTITTQLYKARKNSPQAINKSVHSRYAIQDKYQILLKTSSLSEEDKGSFLREMGLHSEHLNVWNQELKDYMTNKKTKEETSNAALKKKIKTLEKELARKDKALAEMATLMALKKKLDDYIEQSGEF